MWSDSLESTLSASLDEKILSKQTKCYAAVTITIYVCVFPSLQGFLNSLDKKLLRIRGKSVGPGRKTIPNCCISPSASPCPQCSTILPSSTRSMCIIDNLIGLPVGGRP